jgi:hypothetical protein
MTNAAAKILFKSATIPRRHVAAADRWIVRDPNNPRALFWVLLRSDLAGRQFEALLYEDELAAATGGTHLPYSKIPAERILTPTGEGPHVPAP